MTEARKLLGKTEARKLLRKTEARKLLHKTEARKLLCGNKPARYLHRSTTVSLIPTVVHYKHSL